jgi:hypothetical protein
MTSTGRMRVSALAALLAAASLLAACGGDDGPTTAADSGEQAAESSGEGNGSGGGGSQVAESEELTDPLGGEPPPPVEKIRVPPVPKGADDSVQTFGREADDAESAEATQAVRGFFGGRADGEWAAACYYVSAETTATLTGLVKDGAGCVSALRELSRQAPRKALKQEARVKVGSVRIKGDQGFVIYKGMGGEWFAVPLNKEGGAWKLGALAGYPLT